MVRQFLVRRLALGCPYLKPSTATAEDGLRHPASRRRCAGFYSVSIAAVDALRNAASGPRTARRSVLQHLAPGLKWFQHRNHARDVDSQITTLAANGLQQHRWKHMSFKETARTGAVGYSSITFRAMEFSRKPAPNCSAKGSHKYLLNNTFITLPKMQSCGRKGADQICLIVL
jgi:hypothetical protein